MELIKITGSDSPGLLQRVLVELGRRKLEVRKVFMSREDGQTTIMIEADVGGMNGKLLFALDALTDVVTAEYLKEGAYCLWESKPDGSSHVIASGGAP